MSLSLIQTVQEMRRRTLLSYLKVSNIHLGGKLTSLWFYIFTSVRNIDRAPNRKIEDTPI